MRTKCKGKSTVFFADPPRIISGGTMVGKVEAQAPLAAFFALALGPPPGGGGFEIISLLIRLSAPPVAPPTGSVD